MLQKSLNEQLKSFHKADIIQDMRSAEKQAVKEKKRKTRRERNKIKEWQMGKKPLSHSNKKKPEKFSKAISAVLEKSHFKKSIPNTKFGESRSNLPAQKFGMSGNIVKSKTVVQNPLFVSEELEKMTNDEVNKISVSSIFNRNVMNRDKYSSRSNTEDVKVGSDCETSEKNVMSQISCNSTKDKKDFDCRKRIRMNKLTNKTNTAVHSQKFTPSSAECNSEVNLNMTSELQNSEKTPSQNLPSKPDIASLADELLSNVKVENLFPGEDLLKRTSDELFSTLDISSALLKSKSNSLHHKLRCHKTPTRTPLNSYDMAFFRGSCSSGTARRNTSHVR